MLPPHQTFLGKVVRLPLRFLPAGATVPILRGPACGKWWVSTAAANGYWLGFWELENQRRFSASLQAGDVVYEIGAHAGLYVLASIDRIGLAGHIYAFEPLPRNLKFLRRHVELNHLSNCTVVEAAVCRAGGYRQLDATVCHSEARLSATGAVTVPAISIDEFLFGGSGRRAPTIMRIDAREAEVEVLSGARRTLVEFAPLLLISIYSSESEMQCAAFLKSLGYSIHLLGPGIFRAVAPKAPARLERGCPVELRG